VARDDVADVPEARPMRQPHARLHLVSEALRPAESMSWQRFIESDELAPEGRGSPMCLPASVSW
jgi:hypothetical protein